MSQADRVQPPFVRYQRGLLSGGAESAVLRTRPQVGEKIGSLAPATARGK